MDQQGFLWLGTQHGVYKLDQNLQSIKLYRHDPLDHTTISSNDIYTLLVDHNNVLWVGTANDGLNKFNLGDESFTRILHESGNPYSISENSIRSIYEDSSGTLWVGTRGAGISRFHPQRISFVHYRHNPNNKNSINGNVVLSLHQSRDEMLWVGTTHGLSKFDRQHDVVTHYKNEYGNKNSISSNVVRAVIEDHIGDIWVGTSRGLDVISAATGKVRHYFTHTYIRVLYEDDDNVVWVGTQDGLRRYQRDSDTFVYYENDAALAHTLSHNSIRSIYQAKDGVMWVGTYMGLNKYIREKDTFARYWHHSSDLNSLSDNAVYCITEDNQGDLWVATAAGLNRLDQKTNRFKRYREKDGLANELIYSILTDNDGMLWMGTNSSLSMFDPITQVFKNFDISDGLQSNEFNSNAFYVSRKSGEVFFGGVNGINSFFPRDIQDNPNIPSIYLTDFKIFNQSIPVKKSYISETKDFQTKFRLDNAIYGTDEMVLSYKDSVISFEFAALEYSTPSKNQYAYKMQGFDQSWIYSGNRRFVTYTNLDPGVYWFKVKGSNDDGVWNDQGAQIKITVTPPWWKTWWFRVAVLVLVMFGIFFVFKLRVNAIQTRNRLLKQEVIARTKELEAQKNSLEEALSELSETKDALIESAHKAGMADSATGVLHNVGNILTSITTSAGVLTKALSDSVTLRYAKAAQVLSENLDNLDKFLLKDPKGKQLIGYIVELGNASKDENRELTEHTCRLVEKISLIRDAIASQQDYATASALTDELKLQDLIEEALLLQSVSIERHEIMIEKLLDESIPKIKLQKAKVIQILINLYKNAKESMSEIQGGRAVLTIETYRDSQYAYIKVSDNGVGIEQDKLDEIFSYGFTTKLNGHGFGLHSCANYMSEMNGKIWVESDGLNKGAAFILGFQLYLPD